MLLTDLNIQRSYRSNKNNMVKDFYNPTLSVAKCYKRAVGYFTISSLVNCAQGLSNLISNGGIVEIIASPKLSKQDIDTIELGYRMKSDVILDAMIREFNDITSTNIKEKLNYIATLIADGRLNIKIALMDNYGAYHEKFGIIEDIMNNKILFTGSMNETNNGQYINFESFVVFKSWDEEGNKYIQEYEDDFNNLWNNKTDSLNVQPFPEALKNKLLEYRLPTYKKETDQVNESGDESLMKIRERPIIPSWFNPREYQIEAIENWENNNFSGLLAMATGTGKTLTGLYGVCKLWEKLQKMVIVIVCPYQHLVEQWVEDVKKFNLEPIICYSKYFDWREKLYRKVKLFNYGTIDNFTVVTTNSTFTTSEMQKFLKEIVGNILLVIDEAHNAGTASMKRCLDEKYEYRLGLSATPRRFRDEENTKFIFDFFGGEVFSFDLEQAIAQGYLTKYYYYPHLVRLTDTEQDEYNQLSLKIAQNIKDENGKIIINDYAKSLLIKRSRLIAGASNKLNVLRSLMLQYVNKNYILIYCGATKTTDESDGSEERQIRKVCQILWNEFGIKNSKFTSEETTEERAEIIEMFSNGTDLQAIVAIKCLDEGVNIPAIQHAFILASSTDPKEFIQRRGRVLRLYSHKEYAYIHDFVTIPNADENISGKSLVENELKRVYEFNSLAENKEQGEELIEKLIDTFNIERKKIMDVRDEYNIGGFDNED